MPAFADIFRNNSIGNGLLTIELPESDVEAIIKLLNSKRGMEITIDLPAQQVVVHAGKDEIFKFEIDPGVKNRYLKGLDEIGLTLEYQEDIRAFEKKHDVQLRR